MNSSLKSSPVNPESIASRLSQAHSNKNDTKTNHKCMDTHRQSALVKSKLTPPHFGSSLVAACLLCLASSGYAQGGSDFRASAPKAGTTSISHRVCGDARQVSS